MQITDAGNTLVLSDTTPDEKKRILQAAKDPTSQTMAMLTRKQVASMLNLHPGSCKRLDKAGVLKPIRITARTVRYDPAEVAALLQKRGA